MAVRASVRIEGPRGHSPLRASSVALSSTGVLIANCLRETSVLILHKSRQGSGGAVASPLITTVCSKPPGPCLLPAGLAQIKRVETAHCWRACGEGGTFTHLAGDWCDFSGRHFSRIFQSARCACLPSTVLGDFLWKPSTERCSGPTRTAWSIFPEKETNQNQPPAAVLMVFTLVLMAFLWLMSSVFS